MSKFCKEPSLKMVVLIAMLIMLATILGWHLIIPALGITFGVTAGIWLIASGIITILCAAIMLFFISAGIWMLIVGIVACVLAIIGAVLFPLLLPMVIPLLLLMFVVILVLRKTVNQ